MEFLIRADPATQESLNVMPGEEPGRPAGGPIESSIPQLRHNRNGQPTLITGSTAIMRDLNEIDARAPMAAVARSSWA
jgi:hypothetical protein